MLTRFCDQILDFIGDNFSVVIVGGIIFIIGIFGFVGYMTFAESRSPVIELRKTEWECTGTRSESSTVYVQSGKVMVPMTTYHDVCVEYKRH